MTVIKLDKAIREAIVEAIREYFDTELERELGQFEAEFLLDFFIDTIGPSFYNQGLRDARAIVRQKLEGVDDALYEAEKIEP